MFSDIKELNEGADEVEGSQASRFDDLKDLVNKAIEDPEGTPDRYSIVELSPELNYRIMTEKRTQLLKELKRDPDLDSITALAERVGRRLDAVSRDLKILENHGFIDLEKKGRQKVPKLISGRLVVSF